MPITNPLPFELTQQSISEWISQLDLSAVFSNTSVLYKALSSLKKQHQQIDTASLAVAVKHLTPVVMYFANCLTKAIIKNPQERSIVRISTSILCNMAFLQIYLAQQTENPSNQVQSVNYALQMLGVALQHAALSYERPPKILWECVSACYAVTLENDILDHAVDTPLAEFQALPTISLALKRLLLFSLTNPYQFSQKDILSLFDFCTENSPLVNFVHQGMSLDHVFYWDSAANDSFPKIGDRPRLEEQGAELLKKLRPLVISLMRSKSYLALFYKQSFVRACRQPKLKQLTHHQ